MRIAALAAALLCLAAPAAAQPDGGAILDSAVHRMAVGLTEVDD
jgi:hypothetical protein